MTPPRLELLAIGPSAAAITLADYLWPHPTPDLSLSGVTGGWWLARSRTQAGVRWVEHFEVEDGVPIPRDRVRWDFDAEHFAETGRWQDGPNLHRRAMVLPAVLKREESALPLPGARIRLDWAGDAEMDCAGHHARWQVARILIEQGGIRVHQWLARGIGELAVGPADGPFARWLVGWEGEGGVLFGGIPEPFHSMELPAGDLEGEPAPMTAFTGKERRS